MFKKNEIEGYLEDLPNNPEIYFALIKRIEDMICGIKTTKAREIIRKNKKIKNGDFNKLSEKHLKDTKVEISLFALQDLLHEYMDNYYRLKRVGQGFSALMDFNEYVKKARPALTNEDYNGTL